MDDGFVDRVESNTGVRVGEIAVVLQIVEDGLYSDIDATLEFV